MNQRNLLYRVRGPEAGRWPLKQSDSLNRGDRQFLPQKVQTTTILKAKTDRAKGFSKVNRLYENFRQLRPLQSSETNPNLKILQKKNQLCLENGRPIHFQKFSHIRILLKWDSSCYQLANPNKNHLADFHDEFINQIHLKASLDRLMSIFSANSLLCAAIQLKGDFARKSKQEQKGENMEVGNNKNEMVLAAEIQNLLKDCWLQFDDSGSSVAQFSYQTQDEFISVNVIKQDGFGDWVLMDIKGVQSNQNAVESLQKTESGLSEPLINISKVKSSMIFDENSSPKSHFVITCPAQQPSTNSLWASYEARFVKSLESSSDWASTEASQPGTPKCPDFLNSVTQVSTQADFPVDKDTVCSLKRMEFVEVGGMEKGSSEQVQLPQKIRLDKDKQNVSPDDIGITFYSQRDLVGKPKGLASLTVIEGFENCPESVEKLNLGNLYIVKKLGSGNFGTVYLVTDSDKKLYALKSVDRNFIERQRLERHLQEEKRVMEQVDFPFIVKFYKSLKDSARIYFLLEYINGIEMFEVIRQIGLLSSAQCRFFICILVLSLEHLHQQRIVYRDLKPENILVDSQGYAKLIDLGACKLIASTENDSSLKTYTIIGTPHYMAPEVLEGKGYNTRVDMWSLGVCMFEFMCGYLPFGEDAEDPYEIYHEISSKQALFPQDFPDILAKQLMVQLLNKNPDERLGSSSSLRNHEWFNNFDWCELLAKEMQPPYKIPETKILKVESLPLSTSELPTVQKFMKASGGSKQRKHLRKSIDENWDAIF